MTEHAAGKKTLEENQEEGYKYNVSYHKARYLYNEESEEYGKKFYNNYYLNNTYTARIPVKKVGCKNIDELLKNLNGYLPEKKSKFRYKNSILVMSSSKNNKKLGRVFLCFGEKELTITCEGFWNEFKEGIINYVNEMVGKILTEPQPKTPKKNKPYL